jgi:hypothetical protein
MKTVYLPVYLRGQRNCWLNSIFNEVEVEVKVEEKKKCLKPPVFTKKYVKFQGFSLTSALTWQFSK